MNLNTLGLSPAAQAFTEDETLNDFLLARVTAVHRDRYTLQDAERTYSAEITGNLRYSVQDSSELPAVGDWVKAIPSGEDSAVIIEVLERSSLLKRKAVNKFGESQSIAANLDQAFIVQAVGQDFNLNRLERYLAICNAAPITAILIISKVDLISKEELQSYIDKVKARHLDLEVLGFSNFDPESIAEIAQKMQAHKSYCILGSSGVGKSTLINALRANDQLKTQSISNSNQKGRHTTTHRELFILANGAIVIDTPGMREIGITDDASALEATFESIQEIARNCKFSDCQHEGEKGCAIQAAIDSGELSEELYASYHKLKLEQKHYSTSLKEKRAKERAQGKLFKAGKAHRKNHKY
ncbi:ribosome small subunit-dependent GTPase A [Croceimicrobium hydrocarbonivorans]|uniref:Small ribosomal subunit biogenesis GTPase RsgA n=1 Tax=Croceimicrobium hydrocarbonivorans TaxID=2761580 RepID=A0A7H0VI01_9FLAO|nr:ribosome small subunit-dependent GTPase A [Croceimicrobium hydrocarbonivorans]QNR25349.1 ribosome small subunit-dependent GTPase A [Croceimicrobium hydrocarbonivorans]